MLLNLVSNVSTGQKNLTTFLLENFLAHEVGSTIHLEDENRTDYLHICIYVYVIVIHFVYVKQPPELRIGTLKYTLANLKGIQNAKKKNSNPG